MEVTLMRGLRAGAVAIAATALLVLAPGAFASTVAENGSTVTWTAAAGVANTVTITDSGADVTLDFSGDPVTYDNTGANNNVTTNCTDDDGTPADGSASVITCATPPITNVVVNAGDMNDDVDGSAVASHTLVVDAGDGNDNVTTGDLNDTINGGAGNDNDLSGGAGSDTIDGGDGDDDIYGLACCGSAPDGDDTLTGGAGNDDLHGQVGNDTEDGGDGNDDVNGGPGNDSLTAAAGNDDLRGGPDNDSMSGGDGTDYLQGDDGADAYDGGAGSDYLYLYQDGGADTVNGGDGFDALEYDVSGPTLPEDVLNITLDGQANDGVTVGASSPNTSDNADNLGGADIEQLYLYSQRATVNVGGNAASNQVYIYPNTPSATTTVGSSTVDAGAGADYVQTGDANDTVNAIDGFPDTIDCRGGTDTANVDQFDTTYNCETVNVAQRASAFDIPEDAPPTVTWVSPAPGKAISSAAATLLQVNAADDKGIAKVEFYVGQRLVCTATAAPYTCSYLPQGVDFGRDTLVAVAYDTAGQTASSLNSVNVPRFVASRLTAKTTPKVAKKFPATFTTSGKLVLPANVGNAVGCAGGHVSVQFRAGKKTISNRRVATNSNCTYKSKVKFRLPGRLHPKSLTVLVRFTGSPVVGPRAAKRYKVKVQR
jgi:Ca2+-binding RTX toxin-like protein